jgi:hypothetical protein
MSRNDDRLGLDEKQFLQDESPATATAAVSDSSGGAFSWSIPTEFVQLPSAGKFYPNNHPLHNQDTVEITFMTAKEEDILSSRSLLKEGLALDRMLQNILVQKNIDVASLLVGDKNALSVAARRTGYGPEYETKVTCPSCGTTEDFSFDISEPPIHNYEEKMEAYKATLNGANNLEITLPMTRATVECRLLTGYDEQKIFKESERKAKKKIDTGSTTDVFRSYIVSVNGEDNPFTIESFIQAMPARDARILRRAYTSCIPNIDLEQEYECTSCGYESEMEVPLGVDFFWPK